MELRSVRRAYGRGHGERVVLRGLTSSFAPGRMTVITGRSGSGKTTLLRLIAGLDRPGEGELVIDGEPLPLDRERRAAFRRERVGYLPQEPWPVGFLSAAENVALALTLRGSTRQAAAEDAGAALARAGLGDLARQRVVRLSAGEAQRVGLARALASARGLLLVDEPTSRLDEASAGEVAAIIAGAARDERQTVICATHDPRVIRHADMVLALEDGAEAISRST